jgi:hypothetical protein
MSQLPKETKPENKEVSVIQKTDIMYIPTETDELPKDTNEAKAIAILNMTSPTTKESVLTMSKMVRPAILRGNFLTVFENRINQLRGNPANLIKTLYPPMSFLTQMKHSIDLQSVGDGSARMEMTAILSTPENPYAFGGGGGGVNTVFENIRRNYQQPLPSHIKHLNESTVPKPKKHFFSRNKDPVLE